MRKPRPGTIFLFLWGLFLTGAVMAYLLYLQPSRLGKTVSDSLQSAFNVQCNIRQVNLAFLPYPAVIIQDLFIQVPQDNGLDNTPQGVGDQSVNLAVHVASCRAELSWLSVVRFKPVVHRVTLESPSVSMLIPAATAEMVETANVAKVTKVTKVTKDLEDNDTALSMLQPTGKLAHDSLPPGVQPDTQWNLFQHLPVIPPLLRGVTLNINNGTAHIAGKTHSGPQYNVAITGINGTTRLPGIFKGHARIELGNIAIKSPGLPLITISQTSISSSSLHSAADGEWTGDCALETNVQMESLDETLGHTIAEPYRYFPMPKPASLALKLSFSAEPAKRIFTMDGEMEAIAVLTMSGHPTPIIATIPFSIEQPDLVHIDNMHLIMDADSATINGTLTGLRQGDPVLTGTTQIKHFSLIRWFDFGRHMPNGLQTALDNISGTLDFTLSKRGVIAPRLEAHTGGMTLTGKGSCADFLEPDVLISGIVERADLNVLFPEMSGKHVDAPVLPPPALYAMDSPEQLAARKLGTEKPARVGYDIHIMAEKALIWNLTALGVDCHILPSQLPLRPDGYPDLTPLDFSMLSPKQLGQRPSTGSILRITVNDLYGGNGESYVHIDSASRVLVAARDIGLDKPVELTVGYPALQGKLQADTDLTLHGSTALELLNSLNGSINATVSHGKFGNRQGFAQPFRTFSLQAVAQAKHVTGDKLPARMDYAGTWKASLDTENWSISTDSPATLTFSMANGLPVAMPPQSLPLRIRLDKKGVGLGLWPEDVVFNIKGTGSFDLDKNTLSLANISGGMPGLLLGGSLNVNNVLDAPVTTGRVSAKTAILRELCGRYGLDLPVVSDPAMLRELLLEGDLKADSRAIQLTNLKSRLDNSAITGSLSVVMGKRPFWTANLEFDTINIDNYLPAPADAGKLVPVPTAYLRSFDIDARLQARRCVIFSTPLERLRVPFTLRNGTLTTDVCTATFPEGGSASATLLASAKPAPLNSNSSGAIESRLQIRLNDIDALAVSKARKQETLMAGKASCQADVQAQLFHWQDLPAKLDGNWSINILDGYIVNASKAAAAKIAPPEPSSPSHRMGATPSPNASRTQFNSITASGSILNGVVHSSNFLLTGSVLTIKGGGSLNLNNKTINAKATATLLGVPEMPIEISGSLAAPSTNYKVMQGVAGTIGNIGGTMLDIVGGILTAPFRILGAK